MAWRCILYTQKIKLSVKTIYAFVAVKRKTYGIICLSLKGECSKPTICKNFACYKLIIIDHFNCSNSETFSNAADIFFLRQNLVKITLFQLIKLRSSKSS